MPVRKVQPPKLPQRVVNGHMLYHHVVVTTGQNLAFISGQLARAGDGTIVGPKDMRAQIKQVGENLKIALESVGATLADLVKTTTSSRTRRVLQARDVRHDYLAWHCLRARPSRFAGFRIPT